MCIYSREYDDDTELEMTWSFLSCIRSLIYLVHFCTKFGSFDIQRVGISAIVTGQGNGDRRARIETE